MTFKNINYFLLSIQFANEEGVGISYYYTKIEVL